MTMFNSVLVFAGFACLLHYCSSLKCYTCWEDDSKSVASCKSPKNMWNVTDCSAASRRGYDRCVVYRTLNDKAKVVKESRSCLDAATCAHYWLSCQDPKAHNVGMRCDFRCCEGNLCNKGELQPPKYEFFKPSGTDLSCYTCSDFPSGTRLAGSPLYPVPRNCKSPIKQMCGPSRFGSYMIQDRCINLKVKAVFRNKTFDWTYRGCSTIYHCSFTEALWGYQLNKTSKEDGAGVDYLWGKSSCCHGNLCNSTNVAHLSTVLTCFLCFVVTVMTKTHIG